MRSGGLTDEEINALAEAFSTPLNATQLLERAGWPRSSHPLWGVGSALTFWREVSAQLKAGVIADGSARVLRMAQEQFPASSVFGTIGRGAERRRPPGDSAGSGDRRSISRSS
ncbi:MULTISPECIES: effector-associated domain EAD1-containing protein [unclassified Frankia]